jgi:hypothetical protein
LQSRRRARPLLDIDDEEKVVSEFRLRDKVRGLVVVFGKLADSAELARLDHSLAQFGHRYPSGMD